jgi:dihydroflavonol-4-reductase
MTSKTTSKKSTVKKPSTKKTSAAKKRPSVTLITGGTGFLGKHLLNELIKSGEQRLRVMATSIPAWLEEMDVETIQGSITSPEDVMQAVKGVDQIYHLAGRVSRSSEDTHAMFNLHVEGTRLLCDAAKDSGVKTIILASTSGTVAVSNDKETIPNEDWPTPMDIISRWPYYASKVYQETVALERFSDSGLRLVILNPSLLLGPGDDRLSSTKVILDFLGRKINAVPSGGLSFVDVRDVAKAFRSAMENGKAGERYLLGSVNWTFEKFFGRLERLTKVASPRFSIPSKLAIHGSQFIHSLYKHWNVAPPIEPSEIEMAEYYWYLDSSKAERELQFTPRDPGDTLQDTVNYIRQHFTGISSNSLWASK